MKNEYEISIETLAIIPMENRYSKVVEMEDTFIIEKTPFEIIEDSCKYFGSSYIGRHEGTKSLIGVNYKSPIIIEETNNIIFFPTSSPRFTNCSWISLRHVWKYEKEEKYSKIIFKNGFSLILEISYGSLQNQILRSSLLESKIRSRKILK